MEHLPKILKLDIGGNPTDWISYEQAAYYYTKDLVLWDLGEDGYDLRGGISQATGMQSKLNIRPIICVTGDSAGKRFHATPRLTKKGLFARDRNICAYCGQKFHEEELTVDHVIPVSKSGPTIWQNVVASCGRDNRHKGNRTLEEAGMELLYVPYVPTRAEHLHFINRKILASQMEFLDSMIPEKSKYRKMIELEKKLCPSGLTQPRSKR